MQPGTCPPPSAFDALLAGTLAPDEEGSLAAHLDACAACRRQLAARLGPLSEEVPVPPVPGEPGRDPTLDRLLRDLKAEAVWEDRESVPAPASAGPLAEPWACGRLGPYEVRAVLGRGGMGVVLLAFDPALERQVALKVLAPHLAACPAARRRFAREGRNVAAVCHENIVAVHGVDEANGLPFLVMEYVPGVSLQERLEGGPLPLDEVLSIAVQVARGLAAAHACGLVHRDVKPANILLEEGMPRVKITDFGLARAVDDASLTQSGVVSGTPLYMAPEQARDEAQDHRADLFSLGSVLYATCTGRSPFRASSTPAVLRRICEEEPPPVRALNPAVPEWLAVLIAALQAKDPASRPASADEVARLLERYRAHRLRPQAEPEPPLPAQPRPGAVGRRWGALAGMALVLAAVAALFGLRPGHPGESSPEGPAPRLLQLRIRLDLPDALHAVAFSPGGDLLAAAGDDGCVRLYEMDTQRVRNVLRGHMRRVWSVAFAPDGRLLASAAGDGARPEAPGELKLWDVPSGREVRAFDGTGGLLFAVAFGPDGRTLAAGGWDRAVRLWDVGERRPRMVLPGHAAPVRGLAYAPDGRLLASAGCDGAVRLWDPHAGDCRAVLTADSCWLGGVAFRPDGRALAVAENPGPWPGPGREGAAEGTPGRVRLWDVGTRAVLAALAPHRGAITALAFTPDSRGLLAAGGRDDHFGEVVLCGEEPGRKRLVLPGQAACVRGVAVSADGRLLACAGGVPGAGGQLDVWEVVPLALRMPPAR